MDIIKPQYDRGSKLSPLKTLEPQRWQFLTYVPSQFLVCKTHRKLNGATEIDGSVQLLLITAPQRKEAGANGHEIARRH
jgi:hypothetical protein